MMKNAPLLFFTASLTLISLQVGCSKRISPVSGAVQMEQEARNSEQTGFRQNSASDPERLSKNGFLDASEGIQEEAIGEEQIGARGTKAGAEEGTSTLSTKAIDLGDIFFEYNMAVLKGVSEKTLLVNAKNLLRHPTSRIRISGHTDERGSSEYNLALGERRARTVKHFLEAFGIAPSRIEIISYGEEKPFCRERDEFCWKRNRRVHFSLKPRG